MSEARHKSLHKSPATSVVLASLIGSIVVIRMHAGNSRRIAHTYCVVKSVAAGAPSQGAFADWVTFHLHEFQVLQPRRSAVIFRSFEPRPLHCISQGGGSLCRVYKHIQPCGFLPNKSALRRLRSAHHNRKMLDVQDPFIVST